MNSSVAFYQQQARAGLSDKPWLRSLQKTALQQLMQCGFPTRHDEDWKYTSVDAFLQHRFETAAGRETASSLKSVEIPLTCYRLRMCNGRLTTPPSLPSGVLVMPLLEALERMPEKVTPYLGQILTSEHAFHALNTAMLTDGLYIDIPEGVSLDMPLWISHQQTVAHQAVHLRHVVVAGAGSQVSLMEDYTSDDKHCYYMNTITEIHLAEKAAVTHYKIQRESKAAFHVSHLAVHQAEHSQFNSHAFGFGGQWMRSSIAIHLNAPHARCLMNGIYMPFEGQHMDHHTLVHHAAPDCESAQDYKGILNGRSRAVFNGRVWVARDAQRTTAKQQNKNLLLSLNAEIDTKPQLDIFADDVVCTHGATVGQLDEDALFYLTTRGLSHEEARFYLMQAFMLNNIRLIPHEGLSAWIHDLCTMQIGPSYD